MEKGMEKEKNIIMKVYYEGELEFEGEYLNENRWNGKGHNIEGDIEFEIKDGKGIVKEFDSHFNLKFEGEYKWKKKWKS